MSGLGAPNVTRGWQFLTRTNVFLVTVCCSPGSREDSRVLVLLLSGPQRCTSAETRGSEHPCIFVVSFVLCLVSVSVFGTIQRRLACPYASVDTHQSRSVVKFHVAQFQRCGASFSMFPLKGGYLCILVASYGHVSLIIDQLDWQRCRSPSLHCCGVASPEKQTSSILSSDRFTQTSQYSYSCRTQWA